MQNVQTSEKDSLDQDATTLAQQSTSASLEAVHSDPGTRPKIKSRSRFSSAIRKLSGSTRKKELPTQEVSQEAVISSGGEEPELAAATTADSKEKKKGRLSKRFLLSSLSKKSKISPKTSIDADDDNEERTAALDAFLDAEQEESIATNEEGSSAPKGAKSKLAGIAASTGKQSRVQITISGKKAEESPKTDLKTAKATVSTSEADNLPASEETAKGKQAKETYSEATVKAFASAETTAKAKKKLKAKKTSTATTASGVGTKKTKPKETTEQLVVTQSTCDTPPSESAPSKPSQSASVSSPLSPTNASNETPTVVRKATTRAAATITSPSLTQRLIGSAAKAKKQRADALAADEANLTPETQRGFRFSRPAATAATSSANQPATLTTTPKLTTKTSIESSTAPATRQRQLQFQLKSQSQSKPHASQSLTRSSVDASISAEHLQPTTLPVSPASTPELRSVQSTNLQQPGLEAARVSNISGQEDFVSSAESAAFQAGDDTRPTSQDLSDGAAEALHSLRNQGTVGSHAANLSSSSGRRSALNVPQPTMSDFENRKKSNNDFSLQTEATEHSYDKDNEFGDQPMDVEMEPAIMTAANAEKREHLYKILVIGEAGTGKTSFIKRYVHQFFSQNYRATIGVDFALKVLQWDDDTVVRLQLWDIAGQERFGNMTRVYYKEAVGAFIVFDVTRSGTFDCVSKWKEDLDSKVQLPNGSSIPCILLANKCDEEKQGIVTQPGKVDKYVEENGFVDWFETSAKENINIDDAARALISKILLNDKLITDSDLADSEKLSLIKSAEETDSEAKNKCFC